ncbi:MAG: methylenetetrahydrofolate reductase C-terminal domain-containing protein [Desulfohalobiaceae bacterium]|nr:methylenetetrahydrofolate reductase C-terminal domain-containing protein [Desulfohalobiaceae bacterium]
MIKIKRKPFQEIVEAIQGYSNILNVGCGGCASVCLGGGQKEVKILNEELEEYFRQQGQDKRFVAYTVERACNMDYVQELDKIAPQKAAVLVMACAAGTQLIAERYPDTPVFPAVNTVAIGIDRDIGLYEERCRACGECVIGYTGGICPVTRCAKGLFNGPCGGANQGMCEVDSSIPCAWQEIFERLKRQNRLQDIMKIRPAMQWRNQTQRTVIQIGYEERYMQQE